MPRPKRLRRPHAANFETLESRTLLAAFGTPWPEPRDLTISFPADGVAIGNRVNDLAETLDQAGDTQQWQELILRAYQTWAIHADINIGLRNDFDVAFGSHGMTNNDPRFGEFRIGAFPQQGLLASSLPFQSVAGTYSGDLLLNSNQNFKLHDWNDDTGPDTTQWDPLDRDLFSVLLHESGNTLGVDDNLTEWSVMFGQYTVPKGLLSPEDISEIQSLYGLRSDPYEALSNDDVQMATLLPQPINFAPATDVVRTRASIVSATDIDHYKFVPATGQDSVTIKVKSAGISLLRSRLEVIDAAGEVLQSSAAASVFDNDHSITLTGINGSAEIMVRVLADDTDDVYSVGDYVLELDYRSAADQQLDHVPGDYASGADALFTGFDLADPEDVRQTIASADTVSSTIASTDRFEVISSVASAADADVWKIVAPDSARQSLQVSVSGVGQAHPEIMVRVIDSTGQQVGSSARLRNDGSWTVEVTSPTVGAEYFVRISIDPSSAVHVGNYVAVAEFITPSQQMNELVSGDASSEMDEFYRWTAGKSKLYRFDLSASDGSSTEGIRMRIYDAETSELRMVIGVQNDITRSGLAWLDQGDYLIRITAFEANDAPVDAIHFTLTCDGLSDDQDDDPYDPDTDPYYDAYYYEYNPAYYYYYYSTYEYYYNWDEYYEYDGDPDYQYYYTGEYP
ncbi:Matrixin [Rubripirellula tenax]|uniref:Matrixin n=1 Tax=Rubripirellula tenax TaxID=2528015 RepID=A0A5C6EDZ4_9BACT|nr:matrixin family metalloprotease [Rubripirellula tenax]TWU47252.1 Matrixin [Rubripirellula tenax]